MKTINVENATLDDCVRDSQSERIVVTRKGVPVAVVVGVEGLDEEQIRLGCSDEFWRTIMERRKHSTLTRTELERKLGPPVRVIDRRTSD